MSAADVVFVVGSVICVQFTLLAVAGSSFRVELYVGNGAMVVVDEIVNLVGHVVVRNDVMVGVLVLRAVV